MKLERVAVFLALLSPGALAFAPRHVVRGPRSSRASAVIRSSAVAPPLTYPANAEQVAVGSLVPDTPLNKASDEVPASSLMDVLGKEKTVLVTVPGAFTTTCSERHVPSFLDSAEALQSEGISKVVVLSVNDRFVMKAWDASLGLERFRDDASSFSAELIADGQGAISASLGLLVDKGAMGGRCMRSALVVEEGQVTYAGLDQEGLEASSAESVLAFLKADREAKEEAARLAAEKAAAEKAAAEKALAASGGTGGPQAAIVAGGVLVTLGAVGVAVALEQGIITL